MGLRLGHGADDGRSDRNVVEPDEFVEIVYEPDEPMITAV